MFGYFKRTVNDVYDGRAIANVDLGNGEFVALTESANGVSAALTGATPTEIPYMVCGVDDSQPEEGINTVNFVTKAGKYLRLKKPAIDEIFVTSAITSGVTCAVGTKYTVHSGKIDTIGASEDPIQSYICIEVGTVDGLAVATFRVL